MFGVVVLGHCHKSGFLYQYIGFFNAVSLIGQSAPPEMLRKLTYLALRHPQVKRIDTVRAYTFGVLYFVEVSH